MNITLKSVSSEMIELEREICFLSDIYANIPKQGDKESFISGLRDVTGKKGIGKEQLNSIIKERIYSVLNFLISINEWLGFSIIQKRERLSSLIDFNSSHCKVFTFEEMNQLIEHSVVELLDLAKQLFQYEEDEESDPVYLDIYFSREIFVNLLKYYEITKNIFGMIECNYWLLRISYCLVDYESALFYYNNNKAFIGSYGSLSSTSQNYIVRTMANVGLTFNIFKISLDRLRGFIKESEEAEKFLWTYFINPASVEKKNYKFVWNIYYNIIDGYIEFCRVQNSRKRRSFSTEALKYLEKAKMYQKTFLAENQVSMLDLASYELMHYSGKLNMSNYKIKLDELEEKIKSGYEVFNFSKDEFLLSIREKYLFSVVNCNNFTVSEKISLLKQIFQDTFTILSNGRMSFEENSFRKYIKTYVKLAGNICAKEDIVKDILEIQKKNNNNNFFTYFHVLIVGILAEKLTERLIEVNPKYFINVCSAKTIKSVIRKKYQLMSFLKFCGYCHDVGKIGIQDIVGAIRSLTDFEFRLIKKHTENGYDVLSASEETKEFSYVELMHHRSYDGLSGYPEIVPEEALRHKVPSEIIKFCDGLQVWSDIYGRVYLDKQRTGDHYQDLCTELNKMRQRAGTYYDPNIFTAFDDPGGEDFTRHFAEFLSPKSIEELMYRAYNGYIRA